MKHTGLTEQQTAQLCRGLALYLHAGMGLGEGLFLLSKECDGDQSLLVYEVSSVHLREFFLRFWPPLRQKAYILAR